MPAPALTIRDLRFSYPDASWALSVPHLQVEAGEHVLLVGGSGRGKSTLLQVVAGLRELGSGSVEVAGVRMDTLRGAARDEARGRSIGMIFQTFNLLHGFTALENVFAALMLVRCQWPNTNIAHAPCSPRLELLTRTRRLTGFRLANNNAWPWRERWRHALLSCLLMSQRPALTQRTRRLPWT